MAEANPLPGPESARLHHSVGERCRGLKLAVMQNGGEEFLHARADGIHEVTWGLVVELSGLPSLCLSWIQDEHGEPNRIWCPEPEWFATVASLELQQLDLLPPWRDYVGRRVLFFQVHTYPSNYGFGPKHWHQVPWGVELVFDGISLLVAAARHGQALTDPICNDEIVLAYTPESVAAMIAVRQGYVEEWS